MTKRRMQSVQCFVKKIRSKLPRRHRSHISPILCRKKSPTLAAVVVSGPNARSSQLTRVSVCKRKPPPQPPAATAAVPKKQSFDERFGGGGDQFRRITRSHCRKRENETLTSKQNEEIESESSCVESCSGVAVAGERSLKFFANEVTGDESEGISRSEISCVRQISKTRAETYVGNRESEVVSSVNYQQNSPNGTKFSTILSCIDKLSDRTVKGGQNRVEAGGNNESLPQLISVEVDLACSEHLSCADEEVEVSDDYSSVAAYSNIFEDNSEIDFSSDYTPSVWYDSGSQFSEGSIGENDTSPSPTFHLFRLYSDQFCKTFSKTSVKGNSSWDGTNNRLRLEVDEDEESYLMLRERERRQVYVRDYAREYCTDTSYGQLIVQQRLQIVHWIIEQSANMEFQRETMFLGVNLLDRFLSKGYFKSKRNLQIVGIACLTLATRIEENQPFNSVRQKTLQIDGNAYSRCEVVAMEWLVQEILNFQCLLPTINNFLWFYLKAAKADEETEKTARYLAVLALLGHEQLNYWPSTVAAALVTFACSAADEDSSCQQNFEEILRFCSKLISVRSLLKIWSKRGFHFSSMEPAN